MQSIDNKKTVRLFYRFISGWVLKLLISIACANIPQVVMAQASSVIKQPVKDVEPYLDSAAQRLEKQFGKNKIIPARFRPQILYALSYFPSLANTRIIFTIKKSTGGIISTRPTTAGLFRRSSKRTYLVVINDTVKGRTLPVFGSAPRNAQVGILGHELCHILYFNGRTGAGLLGLGIGHVSKKYIDRFEYATDSVDIAQGLGYQLLSWKLYLDSAFRKRSPDGLPSFATDTSRRRYMRADEIRVAIARNSAYR